MRHCLEGHVNRALLLPLLDLILLFLGWLLRSSRLLFLVLGRLFSTVCSRGTFVILLFLCLRFGLRLGSALRLDWDLLLLGPAFRHLDALKLWNLIGIVLDADGQLGRASLNVGLGALATTDFVLCNRLRQTVHNLIALTVVNLERTVTILVIELELLDDGELLTNIKEVAVLFGILGRSSLWVLELIIHGHGDAVVIVHRESLHVEVRGEHG